jgi:DNA-binding transcriptional ArsR family regulator
LNILSMVAYDEERMKPLFHPSVDDITVEGILHALSDPVRAHIFAEIASSQCPQMCSAFLNVSDRTVPKSTLSQHFKALREAGLIRSERKGVGMHNTPRCDEIESRFAGLIPAIIQAHKTQSDRKQHSRQSKRAKKSR